MHRPRRCSSATGIHPTCHEFRLQHCCARGSVCLLVDFGVGMPPHRASSRPLLGDPVLTVTMGPMRAKKNATLRPRNCSPDLPYGFGACPSVKAKQQYEMEAWEHVRMRAWPAVHTCVRTHSHRLSPPQYPEAARLESDAAEPCLATFESPPLRLRHFVVSKIWPTLHNSELTPN